MAMVKKTSADKLKKVGDGKTDPLTLAKTKIIEAIKVQKGYLADTIAGKTIPKTSGNRERSLWFVKQADGWWTTVRYGQIPIPISGTETAVLISEKLEDVAAFYDAVAKAIQAGELDAQIGKLMADRSASLKGSR